MKVGTQIGRSWGRGCGQVQRSLRQQAGSCVAATAPSPSPIQKQSASRLSSTAPMNQGPSPGLPVVKDKLETYIAQMTVGTHPDTPRSRGRAIKVWQDDISPAKELAVTEMSLEEKPRKRPRWKTGVLKKCNRCAECEAFTMKLHAIAHEKTTKGSGCACHCSQIHSKTGDLKTCLRCDEWEALTNWLHAVAKWGMDQECMHKSRS